MYRGVLRLAVPFGNAFFSRAETRKTGYTNRTSSEYQNDYRRNENKVDAIWMVFYSGCITNPFAVIEQFASLLFIVRRA